MDVARSFEYERVLSEDPRTRLLVLAGTAVPPSSSSRQPCILLLEKSHFPSDPTKSLRWSKVKELLANDVYGNVDGWLEQDEGREPDLNIRSICPANAKHFSKYGKQETRLIRETPALYEAVIRPYVESLPASQINWVYNILEGKSEAEKVIYSDQDPERGFILIPDLKWDEKTMSSLYLVVIVQNRDILSLRSLRQKHLPLLKSIRDEVQKAVKGKYGVDGDELRMFVHYQPTYYHFHVHITHLSYVGFQGITVGQSHLLDDIVDAIELDGDWYEKRTITYGLGTEHPISKLVVQAAKESH